MAQYTLFSLFMPYCVERNIWSPRKITQVPFYADLLEFLYLCQKKRNFFASENFSNQSWQA